MTSMDRTAPGGRAARLLAVLGLLLGLLAMHGLVTGHHSSSAGALPASADVLGGQQHMAATLDGPEHAAVQFRVPTLPGYLTASVAPAGQAGSGALENQCTGCPGHGGVALCLAVLFAGLAVLARLLARRARAADLPAPQVRLPLLRAGPLPFARPPDLVAGLCVSRT